MVFIMLSGQSPFLADNDLDTRTNIVNNSYSFEHVSFAGVSTHARSFISNILVHDIK